MYLHASSLLLTPPYVQLLIEFGTYTFGSVKTTIATLPGCVKNSEFRCIKHEVGNGRITGNDENRVLPAKLANDITR